VNEETEQALPKRDEEVILSVEDMAFGGRGLAKLNGFVIFVDGGIPGQTVRARIRRKRRQYAEAVVTGVLERSPFEVDPRCPHFGTCGGCRWQNLPYEKQLQHKVRQVQDLLQRIGGVDPVPLDDPLPAPEPYYYRNKMEFSFSQPSSPGAEGETETIALGLHQRGSFDRIVDLETCYLQAPETPQLIAEVRKFARESGLPAYSNRTHEGFWRFLVLRKGFNTGQWMVNIVTTEAKPDLLRGLVPRLQEIVPGLRSLVNNVNTGRGGVAFGEHEELVWGERTIEEKLGPYVFSISANSFFQTNTAQAERLYAKVLEYANLEGDETVYDLYCGTGSISIFLSAGAKRVLGVEIVDDAVADAWKNCERNHITNCYFLAGDIRELLRDPASFTREHGRPDVVVLDPPRDGVHPKVVKRLLNLGARRIVYVSCNPSTQARDLTVLRRKYNVERVCPVDMFPQTPHIESVALLTAR